MTDRTQYPIPVQPNTDKYLDNEELQRQLRKVKAEQAEFEKMRARERQEDTIKNLAKKEKDKEKAKRLAADKRLDQREIDRIMREKKVNDQVPFTNTHP